MSLRPGPPRLAALALPLAVLLTAPLSGHGQTPEDAELRVRVVDAATSRPVPTARATLAGIDLSSAADSAGRLSFADIPPGSRRLFVEAPGYAPAEVELALGPGGVREVTVALTPRPFRLPGVGAEAAAGTFVPGFLHRRATRDGHFVTKAAIDSADPVRLSTFLDSRFPNVRARYRPMREGGRGGWKVHVWRHVRAHRSTPLWCVPSLILNGRLLPADRTVWRLDDIEPEEVLAVEVYWKPSQVPRRMAVGPVIASEPVGGDVPTGRSRTASDADPAGTRSTEGGILAPGSGYDPFEPAVGPLAASCGTIVIWTELRPDG